ncbi:SCO family protein [Parvularcula lutaonensis]|uniref:SCO family protein n=1 Tax=Parvularcula lutaonensis TaxID=491923 RepID=A0ABV7M985_9PROT|nr:SCO family protein [Parvularcula lutaonensis]GGY46596.1 photosynthetic protein synthase I [Parvularcula lutaonensis]
MIRTNYLIPAFFLLAAACTEDTPPRGEIELNEAFSAEFDLIDMYGEPASDERFEGKPMLIYFGFTSCPDVCPAALGVMTATLDQLGRDAGDVQPLFITVDPERDTAERLRAHLSFDPRILGLTGSEEELKDARNRMRVFAAKVPLKDSAVGYTVDHQSLFFLTDASGQPIVAFNDDMDPAVIAARIKARL